MISVRSDLENKVQESKSFLNNIIKHHQLVSEQTVLKSCVFLMLYNIVESTVYATLAEIHDEFSVHKFVDLNKNIRKQFIDYFWTNQPKLEIIENYQDANFPSLEEYLKKKNLFSGNLDARKIDKILAKYGVKTLTTLEREKLVTIKNQRNQLSHGNVTFKEACRNIIVADIEGYINAVDKTLNEMLDNSESYLSEKMFLNCRNS